MLLAALLLFMSLCKRLVPAQLISPSSALIGPKCRVQRKDAQPLLVQLYLVKILLQLKGFALRAKIVHSRLSRCNFSFFFSLSCVGCKVHDERTSKAVHGWVARLRLHLSECKRMKEIIVWRIYDTVHSVVIA